MGRNRQTLTVTAFISAHNSDQDIADEAAWGDFRSEVERLAQDPAYAEIDIEVSAS